MVGGKGAGVAAAKAAIAKVVAPQGDHAPQRPVAAPKAPRSRRAASPIVTEHTRGQARPAPDTRREVPGGYLPPDVGQSTAITSPETHSQRAAQNRRAAAYAAANPNHPSAVGTLLQLAARNAGIYAFAPAFLPALATSQGRDFAKGQLQAAGLGDFTFAKTVAETQGKQVVGEAQHPFRHPLNTALDAAAIASGAFGGALRGSEALRAMSAAEEASKTRAALEALSRRPSANALTPQRLLPDASGLRKVRYMNASEQPRLSPNPVAAVAQHALDRFAEQYPHAAVTVRGREFKSPLSSTSRIARQGPKTLAIRQERVAAKAISFGEATRHIKTGSAQDVALGRLITYGVDDPKHATELLDKEIATHRARADTTVNVPTYVKRGGKRVLVQPPGTISPVTRRDLLAQANALEKARPYMADAGVVAAARHGRDLAQLTERMRVEGGHLTQATADVSVHRRAQLASGGHIVPETPGRLGQPSPALLRQRAHVQRLEGIHEKALARAAKTTRPRTAEEAQARFAELDDWYQKKVDEVARRVIPHDWRAEQATRNYRRPIDRARNPMKTVTQEARGNAEATLGDLAAAHPGETFAKLMAEHSALQDALEHRAVKGGLFEDLATGNKDLGRVHPNPTGMSSPTVTRLGGALSVQRDKLQAMEAAAAKRVAPTGMQGAKDVQAGEGAAFLPSMPRTSRVAGGARGGVPLGKQRKLVHQATGSLFERGGEELSGKKMVASHFFTTAKRSVQDQMVKEKITPFSVPLHPGEELLPGHVLHNPQGLAVARRTRELPPESVLEASTPHEVRAAMAELHAEDVKTHGALFPTKSQADQLPVDERRGLMQIDKRIAEAYHPAPTTPATGPAGAARDLLDATNNITRAALIYLNPSYIPRNFAGNMAFLALHQGPFMGKNLARASRTLGDLKPETLHGIDLEVGGGAAKGMMEASTGRHTRLMEKIAGGQNKLADQGPRRAAWIHEAAQRGYKTPEQIHNLLTDKTLEPELTQVSLDARRAMVDFGDLTPFERKVVQRAVFIYPWLKGATRYVKDLVVDRPVAAAIAGHVSAEAGKLQKKAYGSIDARLSNVLPVGAERTAFGTTVLPVRNVTSMSPIGQGEDALKAVIHALPGGGGSVQNSLDQFLQPGWAAAIAGVGAGAAGKNPTQAFVQNLVGTPQRPNFPAAGLVKYAVSKDQGPVKGPASKQADYITQGARGHGVWGWLKGVGEYAAVGSARERLLNVPAAQTKAASKGARAAARANALVDHARVVLGDKRVPVYVHKAANAVALHASNRAAHPNTPQGHAAADLDTAVALHRITRAQADEYKQAWSKLPDSNVQNLLNSLAGVWFGPSAGLVGQYIGRGAALENARKAIHK